MQSDNTLPETGFVRIDGILKLFPVAKSSWWAGVKSGKYPPPVKLGPNTTAWRVEDIRSLISRLAISELNDQGVGNGS